MAALPQPRFDQFYRFPELTQLLFAYAEARPNLVSVRSIGKSFEGRDIWVLVLTNTATGADIDKPAFWLDGNIHAAELSASTACLYYLHDLLGKYGNDAQVTQLLDTRVIYMVPRLNPDGAELALADRPRHIRSSTRAYPYDEEPVDGLTMEDIDGDGRMLTMRVPDPNGTYKKHPDEPRLMVAREPGEFGGEYYRLIPEGFIKNHDGLTVTVNKDREGLDLNRNFPSEWRQEYKQTGAGPYPTSEPEVRAMVDFIVAHPNIGAAISYHTHSGVILRPMGTQSDDDMIPEDLWSYKRFSQLGEKHTGYPSVSIWHDFKYHPKDIITGTQDWVYEHLGALFWVVEIWSPNKEAGIEGYKWVDWFRDHPVEDDLKLLKWSDEQCGGQAHVDWKPFLHPQLGAIEIGGWDKMNYWRNPPPHLREREAARFPRLDEPDRAEPAQARTATHRSARPRPRHLARAHGRGQHRLPARLRDQARAGAQGGARRDVRDPPARQPRDQPGQRQGTHGRPAAGRPWPQGHPTGLPAQPRNHRRPRGGRMGGARPQGHAPGPDRLRGSRRHRAD